MEEAAGHLESNIHSAPSARTTEAVQQQLSPSTPNTTKEAAAEDQDHAPLSLTPNITDVEAVPARTFTEEERQAQDARAQRIRAVNSKRWAEANADTVKRAQATEKPALVAIKSPSGSWRWKSFVDKAAVQHPSNRSYEQTAISGPVTSKRAALIVRGSPGPSFDFARHGFTEYTAGSKACNPGGAQNDRPGNCKEQFGYTTYLADYDGTHPVPGFVVFLSDIMIQAPAASTRVVEVIERGLALARETKQLVSLTRHETSPFRADVISTWNQIFADVPAVHVSAKPDQPCLTHFIVPREAILNVSDPQAPQYREMFFTRLRMFQQYDGRSRAAFFRQVYSEMFNAAHPVRSIMDEPGFKKYSDLFPVATCVPGDSPVGYSERSLIPSSAPPVIYAENSFGRWCYRNDTIPRDRTVVVFGGAVEDMGYDLVQHGHILWLYNTQCSAGGMYCRENYGAYSYLSDADPKKPLSPYVAVLHGHNHSAWHHRGIPLQELLPGAFACARKSQRYSPLYPVSLWKETNIFATAQWNRIAGWFRTVDTNQPVFSFYCCAQYVIPAAKILANPTKLYTDLLDAVVDGLFSGFHAEFTTHLLYNESSAVDLAEDTCSPPLAPEFNDLVVSPGNPNPTPVPADQLRTNRVAVWYHAPPSPTQNVPPTPAAGYPTPADPRNVEIVVGGDYRSAAPEKTLVTAALTKHFAALGNSIWIRRPLPEYTVGVCTEARGYSTYLAHDFDRKPFAVFLHGDETKVRELQAAVAAALSAANASDSGFAFIDYHQPGDPKIPAAVNERLQVCDELNKAYSGHIAGAGRNRCGQAGWVFPEFDPTNLQASFGTRFVLKTSKMRHKLCMTAASHFIERDVDGSRTYKMGYFWKRLFVPNQPSARP
ncbi:hypothetical protein DIPPA_12693 [Diplonema papillatum]|nr:hypothetical protein DIPPA_12693 [Diplonema papillatum]